MPWATSTRPSLSLGALAATVRSRGFPCDVLYPNLFLSALMGCNGYEYVTNTPSLFGLAEHLFAVTVFDAEELRSEQYLSAVASNPDLPKTLQPALFDLRDRIIPDLLDVYTEELLRRKPDVVGFTCTFNQVMASVALSKRLKSANPGIHILLGGPCVHGEMGVCYSRVFQECVDAVFLGEADLLLPAYLRALSHGEPVSGMPGIALKGDHVSDAPLVDMLDELPVPDYSEYFDFRGQLAGEGFKLASFHSLPFEASRGCWWGEKHHCTFCGLNNRGMRYRRKSMQKVVGELTSLAQKHGVTSFMAADNILDYGAYRDLLPALAAIPVDFRLFFEIKANVRRDDVEKLAAAGVTWVQPGFESFSDHVLVLMRKGTTAFQNIQALKWLTELGIEVSYNLLVGFPGETDADYAGMLRLLKKLHHLPSPGPEAHVAQVQRFAPFHFDREAQGIGEIRGAAFYDHLIPPDKASSSEFAYFFDREISPDSPLERHRSALNECLGEWSRSNRKLSLHLGAGSVELITVSGTTRTSEPMSRLASVILVLGDELTSETHVIARVCSAGIGSPESVANAVSELEDAGLLVRGERGLLSLVPFSRPQSSERLALWLRTWCDTDPRTLDPARNTSDA
ncbi:MAG TPA: RiPP maturation radical SAM C-methyltransferase [Thermoanaerobaculia bacterium]|nr:RiPP maturation radical SAM C-methyltransferase [Thermoanaerobaculia bacterium]